MAAIYAADIFCDGCADCITDRIAKELWSDRDNAECPDGTAVSDHDDVDDLSDYLDMMDERYYDSGSYPKNCSDDEESDCPEHCGSLDDCVNYGELSDGQRYGYCFGNTLTSEGEDYVKEAVRDGEEGGVAREVWAVEYDYLDFEEDTNEDD